MTWMQRRKAEKQLRRRKAEASRRYAEAKVVAAETGGSLGGIVKPDGEPAYFVIPPGASDDEAARLAFQARHGRPMSADEEFMASLNRRLWRGEPKAGAVPLS